MLYSALYEIVYMKGLCMIINAYAKINLGLDVTGERPDGYHELRMIMQSIRLHDTITIEASPEVTGSSSQGRIELSCSRPDLKCDPENLAYRAAKLLYDEFQITDDISIYIEKNIPMAAGLGGGSSDAAAVLKGVNEYLGLGLSDEELMERGVKIGADVPFCIMGGTVYASGIGEILEPLGAIEGLTVLLAKPDIDVSTKYVYQHLDMDKIADIHPDIDNLRGAIEMDDIGCIPEFLGNVLESVTIPEYPVIGKIKDMMMANGAAGALMSGSGPSVFGLFVDRNTAREAYDVMKASGIARDLFMTSLQGGSI